MQPADLSIAISAGALGVSLSTLVISRYRDRRDLLLKVLDRLTTPEQQNGRRLIHQMASAGVNIDDLTSEQYTQMNNAFATLNVLSIYYQRRYLRRKDVLALFALNVARIYRDGEAFLSHRRAFAGITPWPELDALAEDATTYLQRRGFGQERTSSEDFPEP
jgi:hypothetical protein